ncbi:MAG: response regulator transcription factor [Candidatus Sulfotelmatobacter sp.]
MIHVLVAENSLIHTQGLADALRCDSDLHIDTFSSDTWSLLMTLVKNRIDVLVVSCRVGNESEHEFELVRQLHEALPSLKIIVLLDYSKPEFALQAFRAGARGLVGGDESVSMLCKCIHVVNQGEIWANSEQLSDAINALASAPHVRAIDARGMSLLSKREADVVSSLAEGLTNREIAERLGLSQHTVKNHLFRIFDKLGVSNRTELLFMTLSHGKPAFPAVQELLEASGLHPDYCLTEGEESASNRALAHGVR